MTDAQLLDQIASIIAAHRAGAVTPPVEVPPPPPAPVVPVIIPPTMNGYPLNGSLEAPGRWVFHRGPRNARYLIPEVAPGTLLEVSASGGYEQVKLTLYGPDGAMLRDERNMPSTRDFVAGAGEVRGRAPVAGLYQVEVEGGGSLTTINHRRS